MECDPQTQGMSCQFYLQPILSLGFLDKGDRLTSNLFDIFDASGSRNVSLIRVRTVHAKARFEASQTGLWKKKAGKSATNGYRNTENHGKSRCFTGKSTNIMRSLSVLFNSCVKWDLSLSVSKWLPCVATHTIAHMEGLSGETGSLRRRASFCSICRMIRGSSNQVTMDSS